MSGVIRLDSHRRSRKRYQWSPTGPRGRASRIDIVNTNPKAKQIARLRLAILKAYHAEIAINEGLKTEVQREFLEIFNSGLILPETLTKPTHISRSTLYSWDKAYRDGGFAVLIPRWSYKQKTGKNLTFMQAYPTLTKIKIPGAPRSRGKSEFLPKLKRQWHAPPLDCPIMMSLFFSLGIREGTKMAPRMKMLKGQISHTGKPSLDALIVFTVDCMKGIIFEDHSQIVRFHAEKSYKWVPETRIFVRALSR